MYSRKQNIETFALMKAIYFTVFVFCVFSDLVIGVRQNGFLIMYFGATWRIKFNNVILIGNKNRSL